MAQDVEPLSEKNESTEDLAHGQIVIITARWVLIAAALLLIVWNPDLIAQMRVQIAGVIALAFANFYLYTVVLRRRSIVRSVAYLATAADLLVITLIVLGQGGLESHAFIFYFPAILAFSVAFPAAATLFLTAAVLITYLSIGAVSLGSIVLEGAAIETSDLQVILARVLMLAAVAFCGSVYRRIENSRRREAAAIIEQWKQQAGAPPEMEEAPQPVRRSTSVWSLVSVGVLVMLCLAAAGVLLGLRLPQRNQAARLVNQGLSYEERGNCQRALSYYDRALEMNPQSAEARFQRAGCYAAQGDLDRARADCDSLVEANPGNSRGYLCLAYTSAALEDYPTAIEAYSRVIEMEPDLAGPYNDRAWYAALTGGDLDQAHADAERAIELNPNKHYYDTRGFVHYQQGHYDEALEDYSTAISMAFYEAYYRRGLTYEALGDSARAQADYGDYLRNSPSTGQYVTDARARQQSMRDALEETCGSSSGGVTLAGRRLAVPTQVTASHTDQGSDRAYALDSQFSTWWSSGQFPPQWIQIRFEEPVTVGMIRLIPSQLPSGTTRHEISIQTSHGSDLLLVSICSEATFDGQPIAFVAETPLEDVRYVRIKTLRGPSWVSWREVQVYGP